VRIETSLPLFLLLLVLDLGLSAARVSLLNARPLRLLSLREKKSISVDSTLTLIEAPRLRPSLRLSQVMLRFFIAALTLYLVYEMAKEPSTLLVLQLLGLVLVAVILMIGEFTVESYVLHDPESWALRLRIFGRVLVILCTPLIAIPLSILGERWKPQVVAQVTEDELKTWVESEEEAGNLELEERRMIYSIFQFGDTFAREIMVPRVDILALEADSSLQEAVHAFINSGHSRVPVYDRDVDNIQGLLYAKDLLQTMNGGADKKSSLRELLRPAYFVPETKKADDLLAEMQAQRIHMAIVVDEYGGVTGLVTLEDIIEEIIGEIRDEFDQKEEMLYQSVKPGEYLFLGRIDLDDFNQIMDSHLPKVEADTLAGFIYDQMGRIPEEGETISVDGLLLTVDLVSGRRIRRVRADRISNQQENQSDENAH
jgi:CBS domain containing-hemolysin-like protein